METTQSTSIWDSIMDFGGDVVDTISPLAQEYARAWTQNELGNTNQENPQQNLTNNQQSPAQQQQQPAPGLMEWVKDNQVMVMGGALLFTVLLLAVRR
ncbi:hypothetical protein HMF8227_01452 [Saliniradius amylolyticus]|uniref:Uncharacterized protein n=1 Tax=Saliniradius amylolyticus TaxID=2183582 RepID=A0A2S2E4K4_9ALTE|nr:hypothetical protein [Saliniradius amylolyticus]AWL11927.1 hypothetical protein HMF8227_01452 [Saliniradius amylolyticus]